MATVKKRRWISGGVARSAWIVSYTDQHKRRHIKTFKAKREADAWRTQTLHEIAHGTHAPSASSITVAAAGELWIEQCRTDGLEPTTIRQYRSHLDLHIVPLLGNIKLAELSAASVNDFRNVLIAKQGKSRPLASKVVTSLGAIIGCAMSSGLVARNVVRDQGRAVGSRQRRLEKRHERRLEVGVDLALERRDQGHPGRR